MATQCCRISVVTLPNTATVPFKTSPSGWSKLLMSTSSIRLQEAKSIITITNTLIFMIQLFLFSERDVIL